MGDLMMRNATNLEASPLETSLILSPLDSLVVTISKDGSPLSRFGDDIWDYSAATQNNNKINFNNRIDGIPSLQETCTINGGRRTSALIFLKTLTLHWINAVGGCSMSKLTGDVRVVSFLVRYCRDKNIPMTSLFSDPEAIEFLITKTSSDKQIGIFLGKIQRFIDTITVLSKHPFWKELKSSPEFQHKLNRARRTYPETTGTVKTLLIPSKIYQGVLKKTMEDLECFLKYEKTIRFLFSMRASVRDDSVDIDPTSSPRPLTKLQYKQFQYKWQKLAKENKEIPAALKKLCEVGIAKDESWAGLYKNLSRWQLRCAVLLAAFTGMRRNEILAIPLNGLKSLNTINGDIPVVWSTTTKLENNGAPRFTKWVTSSAVEVAFRVARIIAEGSLMWTGDRAVMEVKEHETPLFLSVVYSKSNVQHPHFNFAVTSAFNSTGFNELYRNELKISVQDLAELDWFLYGESIPDFIKLGSSWPLTLHQFRRSMAVYAAASGMVSYPALKAQLKHISMIMTVYYADSSSRAVNLLGDTVEIKAMQAEWLDAKARVEADDLHELLRSDQLLAGSAGKVLRSQQARDSLPVFLDNRKVTKQAVRNGKVRYRSTLVGGCMSVKPCNKGAGVLASACISCESSVFLPGSKVALEQTKDFYEAQLAEGAPKLARKEYEENIKKIDSFLNNLIEALEVS
jgi:hypothetical protein